MRQPTTPSMGPCGAPAGFDGMPCRTPARLGQHARSLPFEQQREILRAPGGRTCLTPHRHTLLPECLTPQPSSASLSAEGTMISRAYCPQAAAAAAAPRGKFSCRSERGDYICRALRCEHRVVMMAWPRHRWQILFRRVRGERITATGRPCPTISTQPSAATSSTRDYGLTRKAEGQAGCLGLRRRGLPPVYRGLHPVRCLSTCRAPEGEHLHQSEEADHE